MVAPTPLQIELLLVEEVVVVVVGVGVEVPGQTLTPSIPPPCHPHSPTLRSPDTSKLVRGD